MKCCLRILLLILLCNSARAQTNYAPLNRDYYHLTDRYEILLGRQLQAIHSAVKPYSRQSIAVLADSALALPGLTSRDRFNLNYLLQDNWEYTEGFDYQSNNPVWNTFYRSRSDLYHVQEEGFDLHLNPVLYLQAGLEQDADDTRYQNTRGVRLRGSVDEKIGFYVFVGENQARFADYERGYIRQQDVIPGEGFWKTFNDDTTQFDYLTTRGYITFQATEHVGLQFGQDQFFIGNGFRSLILSDFAKDYLFLRVNTQVWKLQYTNIFAELIARAPATVQNGTTPNQRFPKKYMAFHRLGINVTPNANIGFFESVIYGGDDTGLQLAYLNPLIFYRAVEQQEGSEDNILIGMDAKWNLWNRLSLYGQLVLDEVVFDEIFSGDGWWGNKTGFQFGGKYINAFGIANLDLQGEYNTVRPFTYAHDDSFTSYSHYEQPLAHPLGANFREFIGIARYQLLRRLSVAATLSRSTFGTNPDTTANFGGDIFLDYNDNRVQDFGNETGQGVENNVWLADVRLSYMFKHNLFIDLAHTFRRQEVENLPEAFTTQFTRLGLRLNIAPATSVY